MHLRLDSPGFRSAAQPALSFAARQRGQKAFPATLCATGGERVVERSKDRVSNYEMHFTINAKTSA